MFLFLFGCYFFLPLKGVFIYDLLCRTMWSFLCLSTNRQYLFIYFYIVLNFKYFTKRVKRCLQLYLYLLFSSFKGSSFHVYFLTKFIKTNFLCYIYFELGQRNMEYIYLPKTFINVFTIHKISSKFKNPTLA